MELRNKVPNAEYSKKQVSQQGLAANTIGLTKQLVCSIERGDANPTLEKLVLLTKALSQNKIAMLGIEIDMDKFIKEMNSSS
ncbi:helix-turn-helix domain-containing protein [Leeuwenhoekiella nanhaiensis]|uniref:helix-turn-helix domain-containing protein n=1 Tax=Leeuwenhoekiella nanhaiensis TaxID=1655491 RepID=UPI00117AA2EB|nr:helix-turn-helix transcriptional regulator [Leeuwenhoekiella nanhaiensis]